MPSALARLALQLLVGACAGIGGLAWSQPQELEKRAAELRTQRELARKGNLIEFELARSGLESCRRALALADRELREAECHEAQRRIDDCNRRRDDWSQALDRFALDSQAAGPQPPVPKACSPAWCQVQSGAPPGADRATRHSAANASVG